MHINILSPLEIKKIYKDHLKYDFPRVERKPLAVLLKDYNAGEYIAFSLTDSGKLLGYAYFVKRNNDYLLDYLAICRGLRDKGYGGIFIKLLREQLCDADSIMAEIESPDFAKNNKERDIRIKRQNFYLKNGFIDTGVRPVTFGVNFNIIEIPVSGAHTQTEIKSLYYEHYKSMTKRRFFKKISVIKL